MINSKLGIAAGVCGGLFIAYCIYFDRKRRNDPLFKQKLRERRKEAKKQKEAKTGSSKLPDLRDYEAVQKFFIQEVQKGEELLGIGDVENGVEHLSNAVAVCVQPQQLLQVLQQTLPPQIFQLLLQRLPAVSQRIANSASSTRTMVEDDVE
ncbi:mitochondrial import receptor subunit TOM20-like protein [Dinothrombium tinctorium]|uniref:Mitochondrial import receptor subunit TOM20-like protein n=1 Tax=Dinothrombium tinctorium TaxID=1965070 RepID=A0A443QQX6_9ACAR|nr:mitochondrial import receptor subunit TOM20-like protein [Dinothrombium tinctorium]